MKRGCERVALVLVLPIMPVVIFAAELIRGYKNFHFLRRVRNEWNDWKELWAGQ